MPVDAEGASQSLHPRVRRRDMCGVGPARWVPAGTTRMPKRQEPARCDVFTALRLRHPDDGPPPGHLVQRIPPVGRKLANSLGGLGGAQMEHPDSRRLGA